MGVKKNIGRKKSDKTLSPEKRAKINQKRLREFRKWFGSECRQKNNTVNNIMGIGQNNNFTYVPVF